MKPAYVTSTQEAFPDLTRTGCIEFKPLVKWAQAQEILNQGDLLLLFFAVPLAVPAKFYEYLQTGKPIFAVAPPGALTDVLTATGSGLWAQPDDEEGIAREFLRALHLKPRSPEETQARWASQYHFRQLAACLAAWLRELTGSRSA
jgi:glycosyltransferase involved in cell wall biosynthesis